MEFKTTPTGQLNPDVRYTDDSYLTKLLEKPIGKWGTIWRQWIEQTTNLKVDYVMGCTWEIIPRIVDEKAAVRYEELAKIYDRDTERPDTKDFNVLNQWETERSIWIEHLIMEEIVQVEYPTEQPDYYNMKPINDDAE